MAVIILLGVGAVIYLGYLFIFKTVHSFWELAPYALTAFCAFFWGPVFGMGLEGDFHPVEGAAWALGSIPVVYVITKLETLTISYFWLVYTIFFYNVFLWHNLIAFCIMFAVVVMAGMASAEELFGDRYWCNSFSENIVTKMVTRAIAICMNWYCIVVSEAMVIISLKIDHESELYKLWRAFHLEIADLSLLKGLPYLWVSFAIAGAMAAIGIIGDIRSLTGRD